MKTDLTWAIDDDVIEIYINGWYLVSVKLEDCSKEVLEEIKYKGVKQ